MDTPSADGATPLSIAAEFGELESVQVLLEAGADKDHAMADGATPLWMAAQEGHDKIVVALLEADADKDRALDGGVTPLYAASQNGHVAVVKVLLAASRLARRPTWTARPRSSRQPRTASTTFAGCSSTLAQTRLRRCSTQ